MQNFISRKFQDIKTNEIVDFEILLDNNISIILGEPASGKTHQLKHFEQQSSEEVYFEQLINLDVSKTIELQNKKYILLDSIDEALPTYESYKQLQSKLNQYILNCKKQNRDIKFILTCRQLEWNEYFREELNRLDKTLKVYQIEDLTTEEINILLIQNSINIKEFWEFISKNYLEFLLKNILVALNIIHNYSNYKDKQLNYTDIYIDLIKEHLSVKGNDREVLSNDSLTKLLEISSSLATYMLLNRKASVTFDNPSKLSDELYTINNTIITTNDLNIILNTALFKKEGNSYSFFHKSVQEFLMAYFMHKKDLGVKVIKELFSYEMRFYEEFEEVIIYLTNLDNSLFNDFVKFDPFIFKRHPNLKLEQQEKLLVSMLNKIKNEQSMAWGRWQDFENTTLVNFNNIKHISKLIQNNIKQSDINRVVFAYLMAILKYNYSQEIENLIFEFLEKYPSNHLSKNKEYDEISDSKFDGNENLRELIEDNFIDNFSFNKRLFEFLKNRQILNSNKEKISMLDLETKLFESLYGIKYLNRYGEEKQVDCGDTGIDFEKLLILLDGIPSGQLEYIVPYLKAEDTLKWLENIKTQDDKNNYHRVCWCTYAVLLHNNSIDAIKQVFELLNTHFCSVTNTDIDKVKFDFKRIAKNFWKVYFALDLNKSHFINSLVRLLCIELEDIQEATKTYPINQYATHYINFRLNKEINDYLMSDSVFNTHMNSLWAKQKKQQERWDKEHEEELLKSENYQQILQQKANYKKICEDSLKSLSTKQDYYNVFMCKKIYEEENSGILGIEQHQTFLDFIENDFIKDESYKSIKDDINVNSCSILPTALYIYLFQHADNNKLIELTQSKENFEKIFFHTFRFHKIKEKYFIFLANEHFDYFIEASRELIQLSLSQAQEKDIVPLYGLLDVVKKINRFDKDNIACLIDYFLSFEKSIFKSIKEEHRIEEILKIISLKRESYQFIEKVKKVDSSRAYLYLQYLFQIDSKKVLDDCFIEYINEPTKINFYQIRKLFGLKMKEENEVGRYDKPYIRAEKISLYKNIIIMLKTNQDIDIIGNKYLSIILNDYYNLFYDYKRPTGAYSPDIYDGMNSFINSLWNHLGSTSQYLKLLQSLSKSKNKNLSNISKYYLQEAFNNQNKDRSFPNSYYKNIFDKEKIENISKLSTIKQKWGELTMFEKIGVIGSVASIIGLLLYFMPTSSASNDINIKNNNQSPIIQENHGNIIYNIDNSTNETINHTTKIDKKINNLINLTTVNVRGKDKQEQQQINSKVFILGESQKINQKNILTKQKNKECKNVAINANNLLKYDLDLMNKLCDEIFHH